MRPHPDSGAGKKADVTDIPLALLMLRGNSPWRDDLRVARALLRQAGLMEWTEEEFLARAEEIADSARVDPIALAASALHRLEQQKEEDLLRLGSVLGLFLMDLLPPERSPLYLLKNCVEVLSRRAHGWQEGLGSAPLRDFAASLEMDRTASEHLRQVRGLPGLREVPWTRFLRARVYACAAEGFGPSPGEVETEIDRLFPGISADERDRLQAVLLEGVDRPWVPFLVLEELGVGFGEAERRELLGALLDLCRRRPHSQRWAFTRETLRAFGLTTEEAGALAFHAGAPENLLPASFNVIHLEEGTEIAVPAEPEDRGLSQARPEIALRVRRSSSQRFAVEIPGREPLMVGDGAELITTGSRLLFRPSAGLLCRHALENIFLAVKDLRVQVTRPILRGVSFSATSGQLIAVCGSSGCGKTTLLMALSGRTPSEGEIFFGHQRVITAAELAALTTFIPQEDILHRELTVREAVHCAGRIKLSLRPGPLEARVDEVLRELGLETASTVRIGGEAEKGASGGQRKRTSIAVSVVGGTKPLLLCDEPISELDPANGLEIMRLLRTIARRGHLVIAVIHDLFPAVFELFDRFLVLDGEGRLAYYGPPRGMLAFFSVGEAHLVFERLSAEQPGVWGQRFAAANEGRENDREIRRLAALTEQQRLDLPDPSPPRHRHGFRQFKALFGREFLCRRRDYGHLFACLLQPLALGLVLRWNFPGPTPAALFALVVSALWIGAVAGVREINGSWALLLRDIREGASPAVGFVSKLVSSLLFTLVQLVVLSALTVWSTLYHGPPFAFSAAMSFFVLLGLDIFGLSLGFLLSACLSPLASLAVLPLALIPLLLMGGLLHPYCETQGLKRALYRWNPVRAGFEAELLSADQLLFPTTRRAAARGDEDQRRQLWEVYLDRLAKYERKPRAAPRTLEADPEVLMRAALAGRLPTEDERARPSPPPEVEEPALLLHQPVLWRAGFRLLEVDRPRPEMDFSTWTRRPSVRAPAPLVQPSAQGLVGLYDEEPGGSARGLASPLALVLLPVLAAVLHFLFAYIALRLRLKKTRAAL